MEACHSIGVSAILSTPLETNYRTVCIHCGNNFLLSLPRWWTSTSTFPLFSRCCFGDGWRFDADSAKLSFTFPTFGRVAFLDIWNSAAFDIAGFRWSVVMFHTRRLAAITNNVVSCSRACAHNVMANRRWGRLGYSNQNSIPDYSFRFKLKSWIYRISLREVTCIRST